MARRQTSAIISSLSGTPAEGSMPTVRATWTVLGQQVPTFSRDAVAANPQARFSMDKWDGYEHSRRRLLQFLGTRKPSNPVTLAGDDCKQPTHRILREEGDLR